ncbi:universal stress protein [Bacillus carboniphilus]|uniref:Universal stress protein n=1 Tax=Bacillus carboniphilus TaxID=86663 RepID=A0ABN0WEL7_9BACI
MNKTFSNILVAFDGSKDSREALKMSENLTKFSHARLTVIYVDESKPAATIPVDQPFSVQSAINGNDIINHPQSYVDPVHNPEESGMKHREYSDNTSGEILSIAKSSLSPTLTEVDYEILMGNPADEIYEYAQQNNVDLIIVGNRGVSGIKKLILGSVSSQISNQSPCPVLVVK